MTTPTTWQIDTAHSAAEFAVRHMMISNVKGHFAEVTGTVVLDDANPGASKVTVSIPVGSIDTRDEKRDAHLKSADFFDADRFPTITFVSKRVSGPLDGAFKLVGDLTMHGVTREVTLSVEAAGRGKDPWGGEVAGFSATTKVNRKDFGLEWNVALETGGVLVGEEVKIGLEVELKKQAAQAVA
jgi:polyisoprenoid-binding protein YceI